MQLQDISQTIISALEYLRKGTDVNIKENEKEIKWLTWRASCDLEYGLFLFGLYYKEENKSRSWKLPASKQSKIESLIESTQEILQEAIQYFKLENLEEAYKKMWMAKGQLLRIHDLFEKKRKAQKTLP